jgi:hypothetical protein
MLCIPSQFTGISSKSLFPIKPWFRLDCPGQECYSKLPLSSSLRHCLLTSRHVYCLRWSTLVKPCITRSLPLSVHISACVNSCRVRVLSFTNTRKNETKRHQLENRLRALDESRTSAVLHTRCWPPEPAVQLWPGRRVWLLFFVSHSNTHSNTGSELLKSKQGDLLLWRLLGKSRLPRLWGSAQSVLYVCCVNSLKSWVADIFFKARRRGSDTCVSLHWLGCIMWGSLIFQERQNELLLLLHPFYLVFRRQTLQR